MADCSSLLNEGVSLVRRASETDTAGDYEQALVYYQRALECFISVLRLETNERIVATLRPKVREYMARAEKLKQIVDTNSHLLEGAPAIPTAPPSLLSSSAPTTSKRAVLVPATDELPTPPQPQQSTQPVPPPAPQQPAAPSVLLFASTSTQPKRPTASPPKSSATAFPAAPASPYGALVPPSAPAPPSVFPAAPVASAVTTPATPISAPPSVFPAAPATPAATTPATPISAPPSVFPAPPAAVPPSYGALAPVPGTAVKSAPPSVFPVAAPAYGALVPIPTSPAAPLPSSAPLPLHRKTSQPTPGVLLFSPPVVASVHKRTIQIEFGQRNCSYEALFAEYFRARGKDGLPAAHVVVEDPYIRSPHQVANFLRLCELVVKCAAPCGVSIELETTRDPDAGRAKDQEAELKEIASSLAEQKPECSLEVRFSDTLHDRRIVLSNGITIKIGRGLDFYQSPGTKPKLWIGRFDWDLRPCLETTIDIFDTDTPK